MNINLKKQKAIVMRLITRIISTISNIFTRVKNISIPIKIILIVAVTLVFFMVIENAIIYRVTYNKMVNTNKQNMKLVSNEVYENFINLIKLQTSDVEKNALNGDVIGVVKHKNVIDRKSVV